MKKKVSAPATMRPPSMYSTFAAVKIVEVLAQNEFAYEKVGFLDSTWCVG